MELIFGGFVNSYERCKIHLDPLRLGRAIVRHSGLRRLARIVTTVSLAEAG